MQTHNALFAAGLQTYFLRVNQFADRTVEEIAEQYTGLGVLSSQEAALAPSQVTRGSLPVNNNPARAVDTEQGCRTPVTEGQLQPQYCRDEHAILDISYFIFPIFLNSDCRIELFVVCSKGVTPVQPSLQWLQQRSVCAGPGGSLSVPGQSSRYQSAQTAPG